MQPEIPSVLVEAYVLQARNLPRKNAAGQSDTFCLVEATGSPQKYRTNVVPGTLHPVWNESFQIKVRDPASQMITVKIWAERKDGNHDFVGVVVVPVSRIESGAQSTEEGWYEIRGERNDVLEGPDGMSKVELSFVHKKAAPNEQQVSGFMFKKAEDSDEWIKRFAVLDPYCQMLQFFESPKAAAEGSAFLSEEVNTRTCKVEALDSADIPAAEKKAAFAFKLSTNFSMFEAQINSVEERNTWIEALRHIGNPPGIRFLPPPPSREKRTASGSIREEPRQPSMPSSGAGSRAIVHDGSENKIVNPLQDSVNNASHGGDSDGLWQKKFDATRRALADQVAQNQNLQARIAELEEAGSQSASQGEVAEAKAALDKTQAALDSERQRVQQLEQELEAAKDVQAPASSDSAERRAKEVLQASVQALQEEKKQLQGEVDHLRTSLSKSQEKVAMLQIQDSKADLSKELKKQLEDAHRSLAEVKQKHLRSEQSRMAAEAEVQELRAALENNPQAGNNSQQAELMLGLKQQVDTLTKRLEGMEATGSIQRPKSPGGFRQRSKSPETARSPLAPRGRERNSRARELCADITSTLSSRRNAGAATTRTGADYVPGTNLASASLSPPPRAPSQPNRAFKTEEPALM